MWTHSCRAVRLRCWRRLGFVPVAEVSPSTGWHHNLQETSHQIKVVVCVCVRLGWVCVWTRTQHGTRGRSEGITLHTPSIQEVTVGWTGVTSEAAGPVQSTQEQEDRALVVTHKIWFTYGSKRRPREKKINKSPQRKSTIFYLSTQYLSL